MNEVHSHQATGLQGSVGIRRHEASQRTFKRITMPTRSLTTSEKSPATASETGDQGHSNRPRPATILLLAVWIGLAAGFLDLGLLVLKKRVFEHEYFYRLGDGYPWIIPAGVAALALLPGAVLALVACLRRAAVPFAIAVGLPSFVGFLDVAALLPLEPWSSLLLSGGF